MRRAIAAALLSAFLLCTAAGAEYEAREEDAQDTVRAVIDEQIELMTPERFDEYIGEQSSILYGKRDSRSIIRSIVEGEGIGDAHDVLQRLWAAVQDELKSGMRLGAWLTAIALLCAAAGAFLEGGDAVGAASRAVCASAAVTVAGRAFMEAAAQGAASVGQMCGMVRAAVPVMAGLLLSGARAISATSYPVVIMLIAGITNEITVRLFLPLLYGYCALKAADCAFCSGRFQAVCRLLKNAMTWGLGLTFSVFTGLIAINGASLSVADGIGVQTMKFAVSSFVPVVGSAISNASQIVLGCAGLLRAAFGTFAAALCIGMCTLPAVRILCLMLVLRCAAAVSQIIGGELWKLYEGFADAAGLLLAMLAGTAILFIISVSMLCVRSV